MKALRHYIADNLREWDLQTVKRTYAYNTQIHRATQNASFELSLSHPPQPLAVKVEMQEKQAITTTQYLHRCQQ